LSLIPFGLPAGLPEAPFVNCITELNPALSRYQRVRTVRRIFAVKLHIGLFGSLLC
jgi:hypothetical protein